MRTSSAFEATLVVCFESVLHVGDFGVWPDPRHIDKATNSHDGTGDFSIWLAEQQAVPHRTLFIKGNHKDFVWLDAQNNAEALSELFYLPNGRTIRWRKRAARGRARWWTWCCRFCGLRWRDNARPFAHEERSC
jgi:hypothetical protein